MDFRAVAFREILTNPQERIITWPKVLFGSIKWLKVLNAVTETNASIGTAAFPGP